MITTHILLTYKVTIEQIENCLTSLLPLDGDIIVCDIECNSLDILDACRKYTSNIFKSSDEGHDKARNRMIHKSQSDWQFYIEPNQVLADPGDIQNIINSNYKCYYVNIYSGNVIDKDIRVWNKQYNFKFVNPIYSYLNAKSQQYLSTILYEVAESPDMTKQVQLWRERDPNSDAIYYEALSYLKQNNYNKFISLAEEYLFLNDASRLSLIFLRYYLGLAYCFNKNDINKAIKYCLECIAAKPVMAEFWCLLGDIYYFKLKDYIKARQFYINAQTLGAFRSIYDSLPMYLDKYKSYPEKMISACNHRLDPKHYVTASRNV